MSLPPTSPATSFSLTAPETSQAQPLTTNAEATQPLQTDSASPALDRRPFNRTSPPAQPLHRATSLVELELTPPKSAAPSIQARRRYQNPLHLAIIAGAAADVQQLLQSNPEYLDDIDFDGYTPVALSLLVVNSAIGGILRTAGLSHHRHISEVPMHSDAVRGGSFDATGQVCKFMCENARQQRERALTAEYVGKYRRSLAAACFSDISAILNKNMDTFQAQQWQMKQRDLALRLASALSNRRFRHVCFKRAANRRRAFAQTRIACNLRVHHAKRALLSRRDALLTIAAARITLMYLRYKTCSSRRARAAIVIQSSWRCRMPQRTLRELKRSFLQQQALLRARKLLGCFFKFMASRLVIKKARVQQLHRHKMQLIADQNARTGIFAVCIQRAMRSAFARKVYAVLLRRHKAIIIQCCYRAHIARSLASSASADESFLLAFKSGYRFSIYGGPTFVPKVGVNLGGLVIRCTLALQRVCRGHRARLLIARLAMQRMHSSACCVQLRYARHYHRDW